jgi:molecular chaperone HtpG
MLMPAQKAQTSQRFTDPVLIGKDILELLSSAMYVDPLSIYREYIQNAADAIDEAKEASLYHGPRQPKIEITLDPRTRSARIRDNGIGVKSSVFPRRMTALGASKKRGTYARGFRGVGRLSGLGYCQELVMRSKSVEDDMVWEIRWDCRRFKEILRDNTFHGNLDELVWEVVTLNILEPKDFPDHFFEVEMLQVARYKNDLLLNESDLADYISQTGPVPFSPDFSLGVSIQNRLQKYGLGNHYKIFLNGSSEPILRPFRDEFALTPQLKDRFTECEFHEIPAVSEGNDAVGWILHHSYRGGLPDSLRAKGLRLRVGNIQVGNNAILESLFPEPRFNGWCIGEFHVLPSTRLIPNGRRDDFEQNNHYLNLQKHIMGIARNLAKRCRAISAQRNKQRQELQAAHSNGEELPADVAGLITKDQHALLQSLPKPQSSVYARLLPLIVRLSPTSKTAHRIISGMFDELAETQRK